MDRMQRSLIDWWADNGRDLPWRRTRDPWAVLVSELMLQQTQVSRVLDRWTGFLDRFPTPTACAEAGVAAVVDEWAGLGYNRRAVHLHRAAQRCVDDFGGDLPATLDDLLSLPGVGPYTARAVLVFAHEADIGLVDTNAGRFVARALAGRALTAPEAQVTAGISTSQSRFEGSDRQGRARLVDVLRHRTVGDDELAEVMGWPDDPTRAARVAASLVLDGLAVHAAGRWALP